MQAELPDELDIAIAENDMHSVHLIEHDCHTLLNQCKAQLELVFTFHASQVVKHQMDVLEAKITKCRNYRHKVEEILSNECNRTMIEFSDNRKTDISTWILKHGKDFMRLWKEGYRGSELEYLLYNS